MSTDRLQVARGNSYGSKVRLCDYTSSRIQTELHLADLFIHFFHESVCHVNISIAKEYQDTQLDDEIDDFMLQHSFRVGVGN